MIVASICAVGTYPTFSALHLFVSTVFPSTHCHYTSYLTCHIFPYINAPILLILHPLPEKKKQTALFARKHTKRTGRDVGLFTVSESSRFRPVRNRSVPSNILARRRRRNGTETWRRRSCQCEHLCLITRGKILLNVGVPRRNGNVTYSVNRPLNGLVRFAERRNLVSARVSSCFKRSLLVNDGLCGSVKW